MLSFIIAAALLTLVALAFIVVPLLRRRTAAEQALAVSTSNLAIARSQRDEVLRDHADGLISDAEKEEALNELAGRLSQDLSGPDQGGADAGRPGTASWVVVGVLLVLLPLGSGLIYWMRGNPDALKPVAAVPETPMGDQQIIAMVDALVEKMKTRPDDAQGWSLLARSQAAIGRFEAASRAYDRLNQLKPNDADILADYAEVLAMTQQESFEGKPWALVQQALGINPDQKKALALAGTAELRRRNLQQALGHWERLLKLLPPDTDDARQVSSAILEVRLALTGNAGTVAAPGRPATSPAPGQTPAKTAPPAAAPAAGAAAARGGNERVAGTVTLAPEMARQAAPGDTVFIFARASGANAPRVPLAVLRVTVAELPKTFELTDGMAMAPNVKLSDFPLVTVEARVSKAGNAMTQPGDLIGSSAPVKPGTAGLKVVIDRVVK